MVYTVLIWTAVELSIFVDIIISGLAENEILVDVAFDFRIFKNLCDFATSMNIMNTDIERISIWVPHVEQELPTLPEDLNLLPVFTPGFALHENYVSV